ncbi:S8 family serine peptidase [Aliikangiella coralliicola]|uniref:S8 family serine peptidase n=1 Tax=Aliikangiella coralliicola TaxID=2592383 RepID=A0A545UCK8_9GAMM|nr:S8 family serine peptidase [Aliikangiella coralliicola]TQV87197.1 S8 family serine peptidase [Aliikangiella coralliicola]
MTKSYTYREGVKLPLVKKEDEFIVRALPEELSHLGLNNAEQLSTLSSRLNVVSNDLEQSMQQCRLLAPTHHAYATEDDDNFLITDRVYIQFNDKVSKKQISELANQYGLLLIENFGDGEYLYQLTDATGMNPVKLVVALSEKHKDIVTLAENDLNYEIQNKNHAFPTDSAYHKQWHLHQDTQHNEFDPRSSSRCAEAWEYLQSYGNNSVVVGVTDDGCNLFHRDFNSENKFAGWGYFEGYTLNTDQTLGADPHNMYELGANHGTACAGVIAGEVDGELTVGAAPACRLLPIKWPSQGSSLYIGDYRIRKMLDYVADKIDVLSNSWGSTPNGNVGTMVKNKIKKLSKDGGRRDKGIVFLWAAGNENCPVNYQGNKNIPYTMGWRRNRFGRWYWAKPRTSKTFRHNLSSLEGVMYIAALASTARRSHYSNYGEGVSLCAPSNNSHTYYRDEVEGLGITTVKGTSNSSIRNDFGGTSSATPLVAGIAAMVISANPELTALEVIEILNTTASKELDMTPYDRTPPASYDRHPTWDISPVADGDFHDIGSEHGTWSHWFGHGKVDALKAVEKARPKPVSKTIPGGNETAIDIPDNSLLGISSDINIDEVGILEAISVAVDIDHTYRGDLRVLLNAPSGTSVLLHGNTGRWRDDIKETYSMETTSALTSLVGEAIEGDWSLRVIDSVGWDTGTLNKWSLSIKALV